MRYILIDNHSGFVWGDSADYAPDETNMTPCRAVAALDETIAGHVDCDYEEHGPGFVPASNESAYFVYVAPSDFPLVEDGQSKAQIEAVERDCKLVAVVTVCEQEA